MPPSSPPQFQCEQTNENKGCTTVGVCGKTPEVAGLQDLLDPVLSVHETRRFKTDPAAYALGPAALGLTAREILFVSSNAWDAVGATWYGYTTLWVNRSGLPPEELGAEPTRTASNLRAVLEFFD